MLPDSKILVNKYMFNDSISNSNCTIESIVEIEIDRSQQDSNLITYDGYMYRPDRERLRNTKTVNDVELFVASYRCIENKCCGRIYAYLDASGQIVGLSVKNNRHQCNREENFRKTIQRRFVNNIFRTIVNENKRLDDAFYKQLLIDAENKSKNVGFQIEIPSKEALRKRKQNFIKKNNKTEPNNVDRVVVTDENIFKRRLNELGVVKYLQTIDQIVENIDSSKTDALNQTLYDYTQANKKLDEEEIYNFELDEQLFAPDSDILMVDEDFLTLNTIIENIDSSKTDALNQTLYGTYINYTQTNKNLDVEIYNFELDLVDILMVDEDFLTDSSKTDATNETPNGTYSQENKKVEEEQNYSAQQYDQFCDVFATENDISSLSYDDIIDLNLQDVETLEINNSQMDLFTF